MVKAQEAQIGCVTRNALIYSRLFSDTSKDKPVHCTKVNLMIDNFVKAGTLRLCVMRNGGAVVRSWKIPKPVVLVDTREQTPFPLAENHPNWIGGEERVKLGAGDYSIDGMQDILSLERKSLADAIGSTMAGRARFIRSCERLAAYRWKAIIIEATYEDMKTAYSLNDDLVTEAHPNAVCGTLCAIEAKFGEEAVFMYS